MATASPTANHANHPGGVRLLERSSTRGKVDAAAGVIYGVKICGLESRNKGRTIGLSREEFGSAVDKTYGYSRRALERAIPLYQGSVVRIDHPDFGVDGSGKRISATGSRSLNTIVGQLENVRTQEDGLFGDLHLLQSHPAAARILEFAQRMPDKIALSHNSFGRPVLQNGRAIIDEISAVYSVDLIGDTPGTTNGLFESFSKEDPTMAAETTEIHPRTKAFLSEVVQAGPALVPGARLQEMAPVTTAMAADFGQLAGPGKRRTTESDMGGDCNTEESDGDWRDGVREILNNGALDDAGKLAQLAVLCAPDADEQVVEELFALRAERSARQLLESNGVRATESRIQTLRRVRDEGARKELLESWGKRIDPLPGRPSRLVPLQENQFQQFPKTNEDFIRAIKASCAIPYQQ